MLNLIQRSWNLFRIGQSAVASRRTTDEEKKLQAQKYLMELLGNSRGLPTKVGQFLSMNDQSNGLSETLAESLEPIPFDEIEPVLNTHFGGDYTAVFKKLEKKGIPASLGQVHFGALQDGRKVAVKVRYPGIKESVHSGMKVLGWGRGLGVVKCWGIHDIRVIPVLHRCDLLRNVLRTSRNRSEPMERICGHFGMDTAVPTTRAYLRNPAKAGRMGQTARTLMRLRIRKGPARLAGPFCWARHATALDNSRNPATSPSCLTNGLLRRHKTQPIGG